MTRGASVSPPKPVLDAVDFRVTKARVREALLGRPSAATKIGRFEIVGRAGAGAMGRVVIGNDPDLGRKVALKLIAVHASDPEARDRLRERLLREARALASLSHPNVVTAYEVGISEGDVYVAMEYVPGRTLRQWSAEPRSWSEIVDVFVQAGRGLAAAHAQGFIHRDFKPDNVLVGDDGRVRVVDFGLARGPDGGDDAESTEDDPAPERSDHLTRTGARLGTPAYRAPEVQASRPAEAASDQYGFCVALYEALHGHRPGVEPPVGTDPSPTPPRWLEQLVSRGLSVDPEQRHPSMDRLLEELERPRGVRRRRVAALAAVAALGAALALSYMATFGDSPCAGLERRLDGVWDDTARAALRDRFASESRVYARDLADRVVPVLDGYAERWVTQRIDACEAARIRGEQSEEAMNRRVACLDEGRAELAATVGALSEDSALRRGPKLVHDLPAPEDCGDLSSLSTPGDPPPATRAEVEEIRQELAQVRVLERSGQLKPAAEAAQALLVRAERIEYPPLVAEVKSRLGRIQGSLDDDAAERTLRDAIWLAEAWGLDPLAADTWMHLASWSENRESKPDELEAFLERASAAVTRIGDEGDRRARLHALSGRIATAAARYEDALIELERAAAIHRERDVEGPRLANVLDALGAVHYHRGKYDEAQQAFEDAVALYARVYGPRHPKVAERLQNLATVLVMQQDQAAAIPKLERAREIMEGAYGPDHARLSSLHNALGAALEGLGRLEEAVDRYERALVIAQTRRGDQHPSAISPLTNLGRVLPRLGRMAEGQARLERALAIAEEAYGSDHPRLAEPLTSLGRLHLQQRDPEHATELHARALRIRKASIGEDSLVTATSEHNLGDALSKLGKYDEAMEHLDAARKIFAANLPPEHVHRGLNDLVRARTLLDTDRFADGLEAAQAAENALRDADVQLRAGAKFELARARAATGADPTEVRTLAEDALAMVENLEDSDELRERISAWLR